MKQCKRALSDSSEKMSGNLLESLRKGYPGMLNGRNGRFNVSTLNKEEKRIRNVSIVSKFSRKIKSNAWNKENNWV